MILSPPEFWVGTISLKLKTKSVFGIINTRRCSLKDEFKREYIFEFTGTKDDLRKRLWKAANDHLDEIYGDHSEYSIYDESTDFYDREHFHFKDYIVEFVDDEIRFGVEREGHSGGRWFVPEITESDGKLELKGKIQRISYISNSASAKKTLGAIIKDCLLYILVYIVGVLIGAGIGVYMFFKWLRNKIKGLPTPKEKSTEEKLNDLMENYLGCIRK